MTEHQQYSLPSQEQKRDVLGFVESSNVLQQSREIIFDRNTSIGPGYCGTYTPAITLVSNATSVTDHKWQYMRVGTMVVVSGVIEIDTTAADDVVEVRATLPIVSDLRTDGTTVVPGLAGCGVHSGTNATTDQTFPIEVRGTGTDNLARFTYFATGSAATKRFSFVFMYQIIK